MSDSPHFTLTNRELGIPIKVGKYALTVTKTTNAVALEDEYNPVAPATHYRGELVAYDGTVLEGTFRVYLNSKLIQSGEVRRGSLAQLNMEEPGIYEIVTHMSPRGDDSMDGIHKERAG